MNNSVNSRTKYLNLVKQLTGIDFEVTSTEEAEGQTVINQLKNDENVLIRDVDSTIGQRINKRSQIIEARQQYNLEQVFSLALDHIKGDVLIDKLDLDWVMKFTELAKGCYTPSMHELWSKILSVELVQQGSFSYRSLKTLSELGTKEAKIFYKAVRLMCRFNDEQSGRLLTGLYKKPTLINIFSNTGKVNLNLNQFGLSYTHLISLAELGLIHQQEIESAPYNSKDTIKLSQNKQTFDVVVKQKDIVFTYYKLTQSGYELSRLVNPPNDADFINYLLKDFDDLLSGHYEVATKA
ncbi:TIGR03899 family protein [Psychrosphaera sp.]|nr:TIGR03899 family protein [Psychrosphaera sp.]